MPHTNPNGPSPPEPNDTAAALAPATGHHPNPLKPHTSTRWSINLFWRTFFLLIVLLAGSAIGWFQLIRTLEYNPRLIANARQTASLVNLSRAALMHSDSIGRVALIKTMADQERVRIVPREPNDRFTSFAQNKLEQNFGRELRIRMGSDTVVADSVNGEPGLWVGFSIEDDSYWLLMDRSRIGALLGGQAWMLWLASLTGLSLLGAALLAGLINQPLKRLSIAAAHVREGDYLHTRLDEQTRSSEVRDVNIGFNRMAEQLSKIEEDRKQMLAGISHDLRTPLARLRLETEMSVTDPEARDDMAADITQVDAIISKFVDYARPDHLTLQATSLSAAINASMQPFAGNGDIRIQSSVPNDYNVMADELELSRVLANLLENARRYGQSDDGIAHVDIDATRRGSHITLQVRDHGSGVPGHQLARLTQPFYRGDVARTAATGAGLGLSIVDKMVGNMGGHLHLSNPTGGGLAASMDLKTPSATSARSSRRARKSAAQKNHD